VHESAEQVEPVDLGRLIVATEGRFDGGIRRLWPERPVWAMGVVVLDGARRTCSRFFEARSGSVVDRLGRGDPNQLSRKLGLLRFGLRT
jgi:hypothetical protein